MAIYGQCPCQSRRDFGGVLEQKSSAAVRRQVWKHTEAQDRDQQQKEATVIMDGSNPDAISAVTVVV
jgi:hypothetical protein